jgi:hypothetical protein
MTTSILPNPKSTEGQVQVRVRIDVQLGRISDVPCVAVRLRGKYNMYTANVGCHSCSDTATTRGPTCQLSMLAIHMTALPFCVESSFHRWPDLSAKCDSTIVSSIRKYSPLSSKTIAPKPKVTKRCIGTSDALMHQSTYNVVIILLGRYTQQTNQ